MGIVFSFLAGLIFSLGLLVSGMANPAKVLGFLDLAGRWDPSLILVMAGAIGVAAVAFAVARKRATSILGLQMQLPAATRIDRRLIGGSIVFGIGWGLAGICPGPALVLVGSGVQAGMIFTVAMLAGMGVFELLERRGG